MRFSISLIRSEAGGAATDLVFVCSLSCVSRKGLLPRGPPLGFEVHIGAQVIGDHCVLCPLHCTPLIDSSLLVKFPRQKSFICSNTQVDSGKAGHGALSPALPEPARRGLFPAGTVLLLSEGLKGSEAEIVSLPLSPSALSLLDSIFKSHNLTSTSGNMADKYF